MAPDNENSTEIQDKTPIPFDREINENEIKDPGDNDILPQELELLDKAGADDPTADDIAANDILLDDTDDDGDKLNESLDLTGEELDVPGSEDDDDLETIGGEDEENNPYSLNKQEDDGDNEL